MAGGPCDFVGQIRASLMQSLCLACRDPRNVFVGDVGVSLVLGDHTLMGINLNLYYLAYKLLQVYPPYSHINFLAS